MLSPLTRFADRGVPQNGQGMVEFALILALIVLVVIVALLITGGQVVNLYSNITATMCNYKVGC